jgi:nitroreductase
LAADELYAVMRCTPATREFTEQPVPREVLERVLDNARFAPSGGNRQAWSVVVVTDPDARRKLRELYEPNWAAYTEETGARALLNAPSPPPGMTAGRMNMLRRADEYAHTFDQVPVHLVLLAELEALARVDTKLDRPSLVGGASIYPFVQNILLGLRAEGLGAAFTTLLTPSEPQVRGLLGIPKGIAVVGHISVGYRATPWPTKLSRKAVAEITFGERYGEAW